MPDGATPVFARRNDSLSFNRRQDWLGSHPFGLAAVDRSRTSRAQDGWMESLVLAGILDSPNHKINGSLFCLARRARLELWRRYGEQRSVRYTLGFCRGRQEQSGQGQRRREGLPR